MRSSWWLSVVVVLSGASAHADRIAQANSLFKSQCSRCHSAEKLRPQTSQEQAPPSPKKGQSSLPDPLRNYFTTPHDNEISHCAAAKLDAVQRELMLSFLRKKSNPLARRWTPPKLVAQNGGPTPPHKPKGPKLGQGDHR